MTDIIIRDIEEKDYPAIKSLIAESFGEGWNLGSFDPNADFYQPLLDVYASIFLNAATFGKVAEADGNVVGAVLASVKGETEIYRLLQKDLAPTALALLCAPETERKDITEHISANFQVIGKLLKSRIDGYGGSLELLAVSKQAQGLKIGKTLWNEASAYFSSKGAKSVYLIADLTCNVGFYEHCGLSKTAAEAVVYNYSTGQKKNEVFVYEYEL